MTKQAGARENPIIALQRVIGNQGVQRLLQRAGDDVDLDASDGTLVFPPDHVPIDGGGGYENQGPPSPDPDVDLDASDGTLVFPPDHVPIDGGGSMGGPVVNEDNLFTPIGPTVNEDNIAVPSFDWT
ncbi:MAG: hypothetical protein JNL34_07815 [Anaerolineae bacterium]|nr:hypothetical protein [Anaerolineae bacterium]